MDKLILTVRRRHDLRAHDLEFGPEKKAIFIGAAPDCDIVVDGVGIAPRHMQLQRSGHQVALIPLTYRGEISVNSQVIKKPVLVRSGDVILFADAKIEVTAVEPAPGQEPPPGASVKKDTAVAPEPPAGSGDGRRRVVRWAAGLALAALAVGTLNYLNPFLPAGRGLSSLFRHGDGKHAASVPAAEPAAGSAQPPAEAPQPAAPPAPEAAAPAPAQTPPEPEAVSAPAQPQPAPETLPEAAPAPEPAAAQEAAAPQAATPVSGPVGVPEGAEAAAQEPPAPPAAPVPTPVATPQPVVPVVAPAPALVAAPVEPAPVPAPPARASDPQALAVIETKYRQGDLEGALNDVGTFLTFNPRDGQAQKLKTRLSSALKLWTGMNAPGSAPDQYIAARRLQQFEPDAGNAYRAKADEKVRRLASQAPSLAEECYQAGLRAMAAGDAKGATAYFRAVRQVQPGDRRAEEKLKTLEFLAHNARAE